MTFIDIIVIYLAFRAKQVVCDFFLQTSWMASVKGSPFNMGGAKALGIHAGIHAAFTFLLALIFAPTLWWLGALDFLVHACVDKLKGAITNKFGWTYKDNQYWWAFGIDQEAHNLTHFIYMLLILWSRGLDFSAALPMLH
ncbi:MAG: DUF3307 domain-containing protein [Alphaproteobacteria bacterium]|nr:MAG: DUF3307 domain-containing protein [Alphaproteobacteria bacterium]